MGFLGDQYLGKAVLPNRLQVNDLAVVPEHVPFHQRQHM
jgi:hypothetical protein